jgi:hypothetical protein
MRLARPFCLSVLALGLTAFTAGPGGSVVIATYPSSQSIAPSGRLPPDAGRALVYNVATGEREGALVIVKGATKVAVAAAASSLGGMTVRLSFAHFVAVHGGLIPDALEPWDGVARTAEKENQPILVQLEVPYGTRAGGYRTTLAVTADDRTTSIPLKVKVFPVALPHPGTRIGNLLTSFHLAPESYVGKAAALYDFKTDQQRTVANRSLFGLLGAYRISPGSWGFGEPRAPVGYEASTKWWRDSAGNFVEQLQSGPGFSALRIPISSNRTAERNYIAGLSPYEPEAWCDYLRRVRAFWVEHGAVRNDALPYLFGLDEPGLAGQRLVARQAAAAHRCFRGARQLMTGNPSRANAFLWDGRGNDDLDIWTVLTRRYYGRWTSPSSRRAGKSRAREYLGAVDKVRARGKIVWSYTYTAGHGTPGFAATEPLSNPRVLMLWTALEGIEGMLYGQGTTSYGKANPFESIGAGEFVLLYPGAFEPVPSARLEQIRDGIEDWAILHMVRVRRGAGEVRSILGEAGLFSATRARVLLACSLGCDLKSKTTFAWPVWSHDASTPRRIEAAKLAALTHAR